MQAPSKESFSLLERSPIPDRMIAGPTAAIMKPIVKERAIGMPKIERANMATTNVSQSPGRNMRRIVEKPSCLNLFTSTSRPARSTTITAHACRAAKIHESLSMEK